MPAPRLLLFDVFGTLVDWRGGVAREAADHLSPLGITLDWGHFADSWRAQYQPAMEEVRSGQRPFSKLDMLHRRNLDVVLQDLGIAGGVDEGTRSRLNLAWHRLDAWPDVSRGLARLRNRHRVAPCSNGNVSLMADLARRNAWHWDAVLGAEFSRAYKPQASVYLGACAAFDCEPGETVMVAAHSSDLAAAAAAGLRTAHIARPDEQGTGRGERAPSVRVDWAADNLEALADAIGLA